MQSWSATVLVVCMFTAGAGCDEPEAARSFVETTDSAGVRVVYSRAPRGGTLTLAEPLLELGEASGDERLMFTRITGVVRTDDGNLAVGNGVSNSVRVWNDSGEFLFEFGREGGGPGEFEYVRSVRRCRPGVLTVFDLSWQRSEFDLEGSFLVRDAIRLPDGRGPYALACDGSGRFLVTGWGNTSRTGEIRYRTEAPLILASSTAGPFQQLGTFPGSDRVRMSSDDFPHPFGRSTVVALTESDLLLGTADGYELERRDETGDLVGLMRWDGPDRTLGGEEIELFTESLMARAGPDGRPGVMSYVADLGMPDQIPPYSAIEIGSDGRIWVESFRRFSSTMHQWWAFAPSGEWTWTLNVPRDFTPTEFGEDEVLGYAVDDLGVQRVRVYKLEIPGGSA